MDFSQIKKIENGQLFFSDLDYERSIDLRKSAQICYEFFNKSTVVDKLFRKKENNRSKQTEIWNYTNIKLNEQGFWLLDWH